MCKDEGLRRAALRWSGGSIRIWLAVWVALASPAGMAEEYLAEDQITQSFDTSFAPRLVVETFNGDIRVTAQPGRAVAAEINRQGYGATPEAAVADLNAVQATLDQEGNTVRIIVRRGPSAPANTGSGATVVLTAPAGAALEAVTSNGTVTAAGLAGGVRVVSSNGGITVAEARGRLLLRTTNGPIEIRAAGATVRAGTSNAGISFAGSLAEGESVFQTMNGPIDLALPAEAKFRITASSWNGKVTSGFRLAQGGTKSDALLSGKVGTGDTPATAIKAEAINGNITLRQGP